MPPMRFSKMSAEPPGDRNFCTEILHGSWGIIGATFGAKYVPVQVRQGYIATSS